MRWPRFSKPVLCCVLALFALAAGVTPLSAYVIWLKDGSRIQARDKYEVKNGRAIITLQNGIQTFIDAAQIDLPRTEAANRTKDYGATDLGTTKVVPGSEPPPPAENRKLGDLVSSHKPSSRELPTAKRTTDVKPGELARTQAGNVDFTALPRTPYGNAEVATDLRQFFHGQGIDDVEMFSGSQPNRPLLEFTTASEGAVFQTLNAGANALLHARERFPQQVQALEILMKTPAHDKAGQFVLTPENAADLVAKKVEPAAFFIANVQF